MSKMERPFDEELKALKEKLLEMAARAEEQIALAIRGLKDREEKLACQVLDREEAINLLDIEIDEMCHAPAGPAPAHGHRPALHHLGHEDQQRPRADRRPGRQHRRADARPPEEPPAQAAHRHPPHGPDGPGHGPGRPQRLRQRRRRRWPGTSASGTTRWTSSTTRSSGSS